jgi:AcrR family transcriptional regulator
MAPVRQVAPTNAGGPAEPGPATAANRRPRDRKEQIAKFAAELFARRGFFGVRMEDIAQAVGITVRALYRHYENKQDLLLQVILQDQQRVRAALDAVSADLAPAEKMQALIDALVAASFASLHLGALWQREARHVSEENYATILGGTRGFFETFREAIAAAHPDLDEYRTELRAWGVLSIVGSPGHHEVEIPIRFYASLISQACQAVVDADYRTDFAQAFPRYASSPQALNRTPASRREQLLTAAARSFRRRGFGGTSIDDVGAEIGLVGPAIYRYFDSKADVLIAVINRFLEWQAVESIRALRYTESDTHVIGALVVGYARAALEAPDCLAVTRTESMNLPQHAAERVQRIRSDELLEWRRWLCRARPELSDSAALALCDASRSVIDELTRVSHLLRNPGFGNEVSSCALAVLLAPAMS